MPGPNGRLRTWIELSVDDRLELIDQIWDSLPEQVAPNEIPAWHLPILEQRLAEAEANPSGGTPYREAIDAASRTAPTLPVYLRPLAVEDVRTAFAQVRTGAVRTRQTVRSEPAGVTRSHRRHAAALWRRLEECQSRSRPEVSASCVLRRICRSRRKSLPCCTEPKIRPWLAGAKLKAAGRIRGGSLARSR